MSKNMFTNSLHHQLVKVYMYILSKSEKHNFENRRKEKIKTNLEIIELSITKSTISIVITEDEDALESPNTTGF